MRGEERQKGTLGSNCYVHDLDGGNSFTGVYVWQNL